MKENSKNVFFRFNLCHSTKSEKPYSFYKKVNMILGKFDLQIEKNKNEIVQKLMKVEE